MNISQGNRREREVRALQLAYNPPHLNQSQVVSLMDPGETPICDDDADRSNMCQLLHDAETYSDYNRYFGCPSSYRFDTKLIDDITSNGNSTEIPVLTMPPLLNPVFAYPEPGRILRDELNLIPVHVLIQNLLIAPGVQFQRNEIGIDYSSCGELLKNVGASIPVIPNDRSYDGKNYTEGISVNTRVFLSGLEGNRAVLNGAEGVVRGWRQPDSYIVEMNLEHLGTEFMAPENVFPSSKGNICNKLRTETVLRRINDMLQLDPQHVDQLKIKFVRLSSHSLEGKYMESKRFKEKNVEDAVVLGRMESSLISTDSGHALRFLDPSLQSRVENKTILQIKEDSILPNTTAPQSQLSLLDDNTGQEELSTSEDYLTVPEKIIIELSENEDKIFPITGDISGNRTRHELNACISSFMYRDNVCPSIYPDTSELMPGGLVLATLSKRPDEVSSADIPNLGSLPLWVVDDSRIRGVNGTFVPNKCFFAVTSKSVPNRKPNTSGTDDYILPIWIDPNKELWENAINKTTKFLTRCIPVPKAAIEHSSLNRNPICQQNRHYLENYCQKEGLLRLWLMENKMVIRSSMFVDGGFAIPVKLDMEKALLRGMVNTTAAERQLGKDDKHSTDKRELNEKRNHLRILYHIHKLKQKGKQDELQSFLKDKAYEFGHGEMRYGDLHRISRGAWSSFDPKEARFTDAKLFTEIKREYQANIRDKFGRGDDYSAELEFEILANEGDNDAPVDNVGWGKGCYAQVGEDENFLMLGVFAHAVLRTSFGTSADVERHLIYHLDDGPATVNNIYFIPWFCFRITEEDLDRHKAKTQPSYVSTFARYIAENAGLATADIDKIFGPKSVMNQDRQADGGVSGMLEKANILGEGAKQLVENANDTTTRVKNDAKTGAMYIGAVGAAALITGIAIKLFKNKSKSKDKPPKRRSKVVGRGRIRKKSNVR